MLHFLSSFFSDVFLHRLLAYMESRLDEETVGKDKSAELATEQIRSEITARADARRLTLIDDGLPFTTSRLGRLVFLLPLGIWWAALCLDNVFHFGWGITDVPVLDDWGGVIVTSLFLADGAKGVARIIKSRSSAVSSSPCRPQVPVAPQE